MLIQPGGIQTGGKFKTNLMFELSEWCDLLCSLKFVSDFYVKTIESGLLSFNETCIDLKIPNLVLLQPGGIHLVISF